MIKIQISNVANKEQEYIDATHDLIVNRINLLIRALQHLSGNAFNFTGINLSSLKAATKKIANLIGDNMPMTLNGENGYQTEITNYINAANNLNELNIAGLLTLLNNLIVNGGVNLNRLLCCKP